MALAPLASGMILPDARASAAFFTCFAPKWLMESP